MKHSFLEVTFRRGRPVAAYLYVCGHPEQKVSKSRRVEPGLVVDLDAHGKLLGIEITAPSKVKAAALNRVLSEFHLPPVAQEDLRPLTAA